MPSWPVVDYTSTRLFWSCPFHFSHPERLRRPRRSQLWLLRVQKNLEVPHSKRFLKHLSLSSLLRSVCFPAATYPVATASAQIRRTMLANSRLVRWLSANSSQ